MPMAIVEPSSRLVLESQSNDSPLYSIHALLVLLFERSLTNHSDGYGGGDDSGSHGDRDDG